MKYLLRDTRIVIVGGGFAGLAAARRLMPRHRVTLIDQRAEFEFLPNIHELVSGVRKASSVRIPLAKLLSRYGHEFLQSKVLEIDPQRREVRTESGTPVSYDILVVATGSQPSDRGIPGAAEHATPLHSAANARRIGKRLRQLNNKSGKFDVTLVGGGFIGVECLGEILRRYRTNNRLSITIVESASRLLKSQPKRVNRRLKEIIRDFDIELMVGERVAAVEPKRVTLESGSSFRTDLTIWTAGIRPAPLLAESGLAAPGHWAEVWPTLQSQLYDDVFVVGDACDSHHELSKQAYHANDMGRHTGRNIERLIHGRKLKAFSPQDEQFLITFGLLSGFYIKDHLVVQTPAVAGVREALFQNEMLEIEDRGGRKGGRQAIRRLADFASSSVPLEFAQALFPVPFPPPRDKYDFPRLPRVL